MVYNVFSKNSSGSGARIEIISNLQLAEELQEPIAWKFEKWKVYSTFKDNILGDNLADMQLICKFNKGFTFFTFYRYLWYIWMSCSLER